MVSIAALQAVERGLITLDDPVDKHLPELTNQPIISPKEGSGFEFRPATKKITLRQLLTHSSGAVYDIMDPTLASWRASRGETPAFSTRQIVAEDYAYPRVFEAGEGWMYGPSIDWAGLLVERLNNKSLEEYIQENIAAPLSIMSFTFHLARSPHLAEKLMSASTRQDDGTLLDGPDPVFPEPIGEAGGAGLYANVSDYTRVLADLLRDTPKLLKKESLDLLFSPQFAEGSQSLKDLYAKHEGTYNKMVGGSVDGVVGNHALGGYLLLEDVNREDFYKPKGTLTWSGMPNLLWSVNREKGLALFFATQVVPFGDDEIWKVSNAFETAVWRNLVK